jgi:hypothetical protein
METKVINKATNKKPKVCMVGSLHGNELIGKEVIEYLATKKPKTKLSIIGIVANIEAIKIRKRFIDVDGNRCFPGSPNGNVEERMAYEILKVTKDCDYVIDIHSTYAKQPDVIIITKKKAMKLARYIPIKKVLFMGKSIASGKALIDHVKCGVSIEFNRKRSKEYVAKMIIKAIKAIEKGKIYNKKEIYKVLGFYGKKDSRYKWKNFKEIKEKEVKKQFPKAKRLYPIFIGEPSYSFYCMLATKIKK